MAQGGDDALVGYQTARDEYVRGLLHVTDRISSFEWDLDEVKQHHLVLSQEMKAQLELVRKIDPNPRR